MEFKLSFNMTTAAFDRDREVEQEIKRILLEVAQKVERGVTRTIIRDINGNKIGGWEITAD